jgi:hypothetical protein
MCVLGKIRLFLTDWPTFPRNALLQSVTFHKFVVQAGADASLVPTEMSTLNATLELTFRNTGSFFGVHVTAQPVTLNYYQLVLASGDVSSHSALPYFPPSSAIKMFRFLPAITEFSGPFLFACEQLTTVHLHMTQTTQTRRSSCG